jgi:nucleotide-binding universal stress UspA family protein
MLFKNFLTFVDGSEASDRRLGTACALTGRHDGHLTAVAMTGHPSFHIGYQSVAASKVYFEEIGQAHDRARELSEQAEAAMVAEGRSGDVRWAADTTSGLAEIAAIHARYADLTLIGQPDGDEGEGDGSTRAIQDAVLKGVLFESGRAAVIVPHGWSGGAFGRRILISWDPVKEAARALAAALPFVAEAEAVTVAMVDPDADPRRYGDEPGADLAAALARHGAPVTVDRLSSTGTSTAEAILEHAKVTGSDLIVMGGYGHSQLRQSLLGGVTQTMTRDTTVPILMAH